MGSQCFMDNFSIFIWATLTTSTEKEFDAPWERQWTSAWNYDDIFVWMDPRTNRWSWTDGVNGDSIDDGLNTLV